MCGELVAYLGGTRSRETGRQRYWRQVREIAEEGDLAPSDARAIWRERFKPGGIKRIVLTIGKLSRKIIGSSVSICPFCRDDLINESEDEEYYTCPGCNTEFHQECFDEFGRKCSTLGCSGHAKKKKQPTGVQISIFSPLTHAEHTETRIILSIAIALIIFVVTGLIVVL